MKHVKMMYLKECPHCKRAFEMVEELKKEHLVYKDVVIETIEEEDEKPKTAGYDYYYVPTYFVNDVKVLEGIPTVEAVEAVLKEALK